MKRAVFKSLDPTDNLEKNEILLLNIKSAAESGDFGLLLVCITAWAHNNKDKSAGDLEKYFRSENISVHLIASTNKRDGMVPLNFFTNTGLEFLKPEGIEPPFHQGEVAFYH